MLNSVAVAGKIVAVLTIASINIGAGHRADSTSAGVRSAQWFLSYLHVDEAHSTSQGSGVIVGIPDSGVSIHPDLRGSVLAGADMVDGGDGSGHTDQIGHGTQMAGLIAAHGRNGDGALGIAPSAQLLPIKIFGSADQDVDLPAGITWAAENGAKVISVSSVAAPSRQLSASLKSARAHDALVVAAAGNRSEHLFPQLPAAVPEVLAVGAVNRSGAHARYSVTGGELDICAPGTEIVTTGLSESYRITDGTSAAAAIVAGAAALVRSEFPELSAQEVVHRLTATATDIGPPGRDDECGFGVLNIVKALTADVPPLASSSTPASETNGSETTGPAAAPDSTPARATAAAVVGIVAAIVAISTLVAFLAVRRRRRS
ncbi:S8 family serine peptidase [Actinoplanes sp. GCM10030250]|uniref:S8 family serine peptidase n=1 Tax=Actinoplanes sp. GCM10030250 TaxID=3273376 RepID=UPI00361C740C